MVASLGLDASRSAGKQIGAVASMGGLSVRIGADQVVLAFV
jgi:hypothetical protein